MELTAQQKAVLTAGDGPIMISAGPGSGKTFTIVHRIAFLVKRAGISPDSILAITFTNKAADQMRSRLNKVLGDSLPYIGTFHSLAFELLMRNTDAAVKLGVPQPLKVATARRQREIIEELTRKSKIPGGKNEIADDEAARAYNELLRDEGLVDFDDLIVYSVQLLAENRTVRDQYRRQFTHIIVDEYQDTDVMQARLLFLIAAPRNNVCVIGDLNQAIYSFRGASPEQFAQFPEQYPGATHLTLSTNFRSKLQIIEAADRMIGNEDAKMQSARDYSPLDTIKLVDAPNEHAQVRYIIKTIKGLIGGLDMTDTDAMSGHSRQYISDRHYDGGDIAVLFRTHATGRALARAFSKSTLPFEYVGEVPFFERQEIRFVIDLLLKDEVDEPLSQQIRTIVEGHKLQEQYDEHKYNRVLQLINRATAYDHLDSELARVLLLQEEALSRKEQEEPLSPHAVHLMTAHAAKGLEFGVVFVVSVEEGQFPITAAQDIKEERRLLYVAMTRAKDLLYMTKARRRTQYGKEKTTQESRFVGDIPKELIERIVIKSSSKRSLQNKLL